MSTLHQLLVLVIKTRMKQRKLNQKKLADLARCSENHLSNMLTGKTQGTLDMWNTLLVALKVPGFQDISHK